MNINKFKFQIRVLLFFCLFALRTETVKAEEVGVGIEVYVEEDGSEWSKVDIKNRGINIVSNSGESILRIDQFGGIYLNGDIYIDNQLLNYDIKQRKANQRLMFFLINITVINLVCIKNRKKRITN